MSDELQPQFSAPMVHIGRVRQWTEPPTPRKKPNWLLRAVWWLCEDDWRSKAVFFPFAVMFALGMTYLMQFTIFAIPPTQYVTCYVHGSCEHRSPKPNELVIQRVDNPEASFNKYGEAQEVVTYYVVAK